MYVGKCRVSEYHPETPLCLRSVWCVGVLSFLVRGVTCVCVHESTMNRIVDHVLIYVYTYVFRAFWKYDYEGLTGTRMRPLSLYVFWSFLECVRSVRIGCSQTTFGPRTDPAGISQPASRDPTFRKHISPRFKTPLVSSQSNTYARISATLFGEPDVKGRQGRMELEDKDFVMRRREAERVVETFSCFNEGIAHSLGFTESRSSEGAQRRSSKELIECG